MNTYFPTVPIEVAIQNAKPENQPPLPLALVVHYEPMILETLEAILSGNGLAVICALGGEEALEIARLIPPDVLISDIAMPDMSGFDLAVEVTNNFPDCDIVLLSGESSTCNRAISYHMQGYDFVTLIKPVHPTELLACVFELLSLRGWPVPTFTPARPNPTDVIYVAPISSRARDKRAERLKDTATPAATVSLSGVVPSRNNHA